MHLNSGAQETGKRKDSGENNNQSNVWSVTALILRFTSLIINIFPNQTWPLQSTGRINSEFVPNHTSLKTDIFTFFFTKTNYTTTVLLRFQLKSGIDRNQLIRTGQNSTYWTECVESVSAEQEKMSVFIFFEQWIRLKPAKRTAVCIYLREINVGREQNDKNNNSAFIIQRKLD